MKKKIISLLAVSLILGGTSVAVFADSEKIGKSIASGFAKPSHIATKINIDSEKSDGESVIKISMGLGMDEYVKKGFISEDEKLAIEKYFEQKAAETEAKFKEKTENFDPENFDPEIKFETFAKEAKSIWAELAENGIITAEQQAQIENYEMEMHKEKMAENIKARTNAWLENEIVTEDEKANIDEYLINKDFESIAIEKVAEIGMMFSDEDVKFETSEIGENMKFRRGNGRITVKDGESVEVIGFKSAPAKVIDSAKIDDLENIEVFVFESSEFDADVNISEFKISEAGDGKFITIMTNNFAVLDELVTEGLLTENQVDAIKELEKENMPVLKMEREAIKLEAVATSVSVSE